MAGSEGDDQLKRINPEDMIGVFHRYQQEITENETKIMQLKIAKKYKEETIQKLMEEQSKLQDKNMKLRTAESASEAMLSSLKEDVNREKISKSKIQMELTKKEEQASAMKKNHSVERRQLIDECSLLFRQLQQSRGFCTEMDSESSKNP